MAYPFPVNHDDYNYNDLVIEYLLKITELELPDEKDWNWNQYVLWILSNWDGGGIKQWDITKTYKPDIYVGSGNILYKALQDVPTGIAIDNTDYWLPIGSGTGGSVLWGGIGGTLTNQPDLVAALAQATNNADTYTDNEIHTLDQTLVHKSGDETITGVKTFAQPKTSNVAQDLTDIVNRQYVDNRTPGPWSVPKQLFWGGSKTMKIGEVTSDYTAIEYKYDIIGGQGATHGSPRMYDIQFLNDGNAMTCKGYMPPEMPSIDTFYYYNNPDTGFTEIWVVMTGGYTRGRNLSYRVYTGTYNNLVTNYVLPADFKDALTDETVINPQDDPLPDGAVSFERTTPPAAGVDSINGLRGTVTLSAGNINTNVYSMTMKGIPDDTITADHPADIPLPITEDNYVRSNLTGLVTWTAASFPGWASMGMAIADKANTDDRINVAFAPESGAGTYPQATIDYVGDLSHFKNKDMVLIIDYAYAPFTIDFTGKNHLTMVHYFSKVGTESVQKSFDDLNEWLDQEIMERQADVDAIRQQLSGVDRRTEMITSAGDGTNYLADDGTYKYMAVTHSDNFGAGDEWDMYNLLITGVYNSKNLTAFWIHTNDGLNVYRGMVRYGAERLDLGIHMIGGFYDGNLGKGPNDGNDYRAPTSSMTDVPMLYNGYEIANRLTHIPDYTTGSTITILTGESYTATSGGFIIWDNTAYRVAINNSGAMLNAVLYPIAKGDVLSNTAPAGDANITFYLSKNNVVWPTTS